MPFHRSIRVRRNRKEIRRSFDLQLTPMLDVFVIILVFLLKTAAVTSTTFTSVPGIELPVSESPDIPPDSLQLIVTPEAMTLEDQRIMDFVQSAAAVGTTEASYEFARGDLDEGGRRVVPLYDALGEGEGRASAREIQGARRRGQSASLRRRARGPGRQEDRLRHDPQGDVHGLQRGLHRVPLPGLAERFLSSSGFRVGLNQKNRKMLLPGLEGVFIIVWEPEFPCCPDQSPSFVPKSA